MYGSFLPAPDIKARAVRQSAEGAKAAAPGEITAAPGVLVANEGRETVQLSVTNTGDRPIQVGSHYHFVETNRALAFDRNAALGKRLDIPAGTAVRFEPGETRTVTLVAIAGRRIIRGGNGNAAHMGAP